MKEGRFHITWAGAHRVAYEETDSTNVRAAALSEEGAPHGTVVTAEMQSAGKGRRGRGWISPKGENLYFSILLRPEILPENAPMLTLVMALSVAEAIRRYTGEEACIKWPNDIVVNRKKVCGILTEMKVADGRAVHVITGVGVNLNMKEIPEEICQTAASLNIEGKESSEKEKLLEAILACYEKNYASFLKTGDLSELREEYEKILVNKGKDVRVLEPGNAYEARALGINEKGELLVEKTDGTKARIFAGEVSVRGIYDYV